MVNVASTGIVSGVMSLPEDPEATVLRAEYPGWEIWPGISGLWHARKPGWSDPDSRPVMVWGEDLTDLRGPDPQI